MASVAPRNRPFAAVAAICLLAAVFTSVAGADDEPDLVTVRTDQAPLQVGTEVVARLRRGERLQVLRTRGDWLWVQTSADRDGVKGWVDRRYVEQAPQPAPNTSPVAAQLRQQGCRMDVDKAGHITSVGFEHQKVDNEMLQLLAGLDRLQTVDLSFCDGLTETAFQPLASLPQLTRLNLMHTAVVDDASLRHLHDVTSLKHLNLAGTRVGDEGLEHLKNLKRLQVLDLSGNVLERGAVTGRGLASLAELTQLEELSLYNTHVADAGLIHLRKLTALQRLNLGDTAITNKGLAAVAKLASLRRLDLAYCAGITDAGLASLAASNSLEELRLDFTPVGDAGLAHLAKASRLRRLSVRSVPVSDAAIVRLNEALPELVIVGP